MLFPQSFEIFVGNLCKRSAVGFAWPGLATQELITMSPEFSLQ